MRLADTLYAGGPGSGCHGPNCGRPSGPGLVLDAMYLKGDAAKLEIDNLAKSIAVAHGGWLATAPLKGRERSMHKIMTDYGGDASRLKDLARNTLVVPQGSERDALKSLLAQRPDIDPATMVKITDPARDPLGYSGILVSVPTKVGIRAEIQINSPEMLVAKHNMATSIKMLGIDKVKAVLSKVGSGMCCRGHQYYDRWRNLPVGSAQADQVAQQAKSYYQSFRQRRAVVLAMRGRRLIYA